MSSNGSQSFEGTVSAGGNALLGQFNTSFTIVLPNEALTQTATVIAIAQENGRLLEINKRLREELSAKTQELTACKFQKAAVDADVVELRTENRNLLAQKQLHLSAIRKFGLFCAKGFASENVGVAKARYQNATGVKLPCKSALWEQLHRSCREYRATRQSLTSGVPQTAQRMPLSSLSSASASVHYPSDCSVSYQTHAGSKRRLASMQTTDLPVSSEPMPTSTKRRTVQKTALSQLSAVLPDAIHSEVYIRAPVKRSALMSQSGAAHSSTTATSDKPKGTAVVSASFRVSHLLPTTIPALERVPQ